MLLSFVESIIKTRVLLVLAGADRVLVVGSLVGIIQDAGQNKICRQFLQ